MINLEMTNLLAKLQDEPRLSSLKYELCPRLCPLISQFKLLVQMLFGTNYVLLFIPNPCVGANIVSNCALMSF